MSEQASISAQAVALWEELTGKSVNSSSYTFRVGGDSFDLYQANKRVQQAQTVGDDLTVACRLMFNLAESPYYCNTDIEPEDSHVTQLNLQDLEFAFTGSFLESGFADIRDFFPEGRSKKTTKGR